MKKVFAFTVIVGIIIVMFTLFVGCGTKDDKSNYVEVNVDVVDKDNKTVKINTAKDSWVKYTFWSEDTSAALRHCKESYYMHLDQGETVSEIIETSSPSGSTIYYFKVKVAG